TRDAALILVRHAKRQPIQFDTTGLGEMENVFVAIVQKSEGIDRLEMTECVRAASNLHSALRVGVGIATGWSAVSSEVRFADIGIYFGCFDRVVYIDLERVFMTHII